MNTLSNSGKAAARLQMTGDSKDARNLFIIKTKKQERGIIHELSFVDSLFMMYIYAMNINELMNKNINFQQIIITTQIFGTQWYLYQEQK